MSRAGGYRSSAGDLGFFDDDPREGPRRGPQRWDRETFERQSRRGSPERKLRGPPERESFHFEEHNRGPGRDRLDIDISHTEREGHRATPTRVMERDRFYEEDRFERPSRRRTEFLDEPSAAEIANRALAPYRRKSIIERDFDVPAPRRPARPQYIRRQSSLDTFDRRPYTRYGDHERDERDEWRPPANVPIPLPIRESQRRRSPPRHFHEDDYEEVEYSRESKPKDSYREVEVRREKSTTRRSKSRKRAQSVRSSSSSFDEVSPVREPKGRKGKTRMPKRLAKKQVIIDLGYPYEEEDDFFIIHRALEKEHIDEIIKVSETFEESGGNEKTTYVYEDTKTKTIEAPPPPPTVYEAPPPPPSIHYASPPPPMSMYAPPPPQSVYPQSVRSASPPRHEHWEERIEESNHIGGPLQVLVPNRSRGERDIKAEIRRLEDERRLLKYERETDYEIIERREPVREVVRVDKDRKARRPNPKLVAAMMATLS